jgi:type I restriction enzyme, S subunit
VSGVPTGYKQTEVGVIPREWDVKSCVDLCVKIQDGTHFSPIINGVEYLYLTSKNIKFGYLDLRNSEYISRIEHEKIYQRCDVKYGDLLLTKDGANTGNAAINILYEPFSMLSSVAFLRFDEKINCTAYFLQQFLSNDGQRQMKDAMSGNAITRLTLEKIRKLRFPLPPLPEQRAIASALADMDALLDSLEELLTKKRQLKQAAMQELLTGKTRLEGFEGEWEERRLGEFGQCIRGVTYQPDLDLRDNDTSETKRLLRANNIQGGLINLYNVQYVNYRRVREEQLLKADDILICMANGSKSLVGKAGIFRTVTGYEYTFGAFMACYRLNGNRNCYPSFVRFIFESKKYRDQIDLALAGSTINNLNPKSIEDFSFSFPPLPEQKAISSILSEIDAELEALEERVTKTRDLKQGMMQELLTGRTRLI